MSERSACETFRRALRERIGEVRYSTWFCAVGPASEAVGIAVCCDPGAAETTVKLSMGSAFEQSFIRRQFRSELESSAVDVFGDLTKVVYEVAPPAKPAVEASPVRPMNGAAKAPAPAIPSPPEAPEPPPVTRRPVADPLGDWIIGEGNAQAATLCRRLIARDVVASPVLLWGPSGVGKTHLLRLIAEGVRARHKRCRVLHITAEQFLREFVEAARGGGFPGFRQKHQGAEVLLVDDVQQLVGKTRTLEEFRQTLDAAIESGAQVVLTADRGPAELRELGPEIASRLAGGLSVEVPAPDADTRQRLVQQAAERVGLDLPERTARALACRLIGGGREVQGAVHRLALIHETFASVLDEALAVRVADDTNRLSTPPVRMADIQRAVCDVCGVDFKTLRSDKRTKSVSEPRMLAMWLSRKMTGSAWSEIGEYYGRKSHSTVIAAHRRVEQMLASKEPQRLKSGDLGETIRRIEAALRSVG